MPGRDTGAMMGRRWTLLWTGSKPVARAGLRVAVSVLGPVSSPRDRSWAREAVFGLGPVFSPQTEAGPCVGGFALISKTVHITHKKQKTAAPVVEAEALASHGLKINSSEDCGLGINPSSHAVFL